MPSLINRILIVGFGSIGKRHLRLARELLPHSDIRVMSRREFESTPEYADGCFSDLAQAVDFGPQVAIIANPATFHMDAAYALAKAGAHLLVEKPLSASASDDRIVQLFEICRAQETVLMTGYNLRFLSSLQRFRDLLGEGVVGKVCSVRCETGQYLPSWRPEVDYRQSVSARRELGGGVLLELSHELDYLRWIFGEVDWVQATLSCQSNLEIDVEDTAHLTLGFAPAADGRKLIGNLNLDFVRHDTTRLCTAIGENGSLRWNGLTGVVEQFEAGTKEWVELYRLNHHRDYTYKAEWKHFLDCISTRTTPLITGEDGLRVLHIIDAARQSAKSGSPVSLPAFHIETEVGV